MLYPPASRAGEGSNADDAGVNVDDRRSCYWSFML